MESDPNDRVVANLLVTAQMVLVAAVAVAAWAHGPSGWPWVGWAIAIPGILLGIWGGLALGAGLTASPLPNGRVPLRRTGPYAISRHPIYAAVLIVAAGAVVWSGGWVTAVAWVLLAALLWAKSEWEEHRLAQRFPDYDRYAAVTPRFLGVRRR